MVTIFCQIRESLEVAPYRAMRVLPLGYDVFMAHQGFALIDETSLMIGSVLFMDAKSSSESSHAEIH
jgi:hypothetical protein